MFSLRDLECFMAVVEQKTFSRAARKLNLAQPPLSRRIAELERQLGAPLFVRGAREAQLTSAGLSLVRQARIVLDQAKIAEHVVRDAIAGGSGTIRLGYIGWTSFAAVPMAVRAFLTARPHASVKLVYYMFADQAGALRSGTIDVALISGGLDSDHLKAERLTTNHLVVAVPADHRLASRETIRVAELASEGFIEFPRYGPAGLHDLIRTICARDGFVPRVVQEAEGHEMLLACVSSGLGVALVNSEARKLPVQGVAFREIAPEAPPVHLTALSRIDDENPLVAEFVEHLRRAYSTDAR